MRTMTFALLFVLLACVGTAGAQVTTGSLVGDVTNRGAVMPGVTVTVTNIETGFADTIVTDAEGRFSFKLAAGTYKVAASMQGFATQTVTAHVRPGESSSLHFDLHGPQPSEIGGTGTIGGTVKKKKDEGALSGASLEFVPVGGGDAATTTCDDKGTYVRDYLAPGTYDVTCRAKGYAPSTKRVTVEKDKKVHLDFELVTE